MNAVEIMKRLKATSSSNEKKEILRGVPAQFRSILERTYNPFQMYHIKQIPWVGHGDQTQTLDVYWPDIDNLLAFLARSNGDDRCKERVKGWVECLYPEDAELLKCIIRKDLRAGVSATTINAVFPSLIPVFGAMKAKKFEESRWDPALMGSVKLDGLRCQFRDGKFYSMNGHELVGLEHIKEHLDKSYYFDGELLVPGKNFQQTSGLIRNFQDVSDAVYCIFDVIFDDAPFCKRYDFLSRLASDKSWSMSVMKPTPVTLVKHSTFSSIANMHETFAKVLAAGYEGLMLKTPQHKYQQGKRTYDWMKVKNTLDEDLPIVAFFEGTGKYQGMLGGVVVERPNGVTVKVGSGFSDRERSDIWNNKQHFLGRIVEVHYHEETPDGSLRHPRFKTFRGDK